MDIPLEQAGYLEFSGAHLYTVLHRVVDPVARILLVGPFALQRHFSYMPLVRWARFLAARRIEVLRYDYRGVGESTGVFEDMSFDDWSDDVAFLADWLDRRSPHVPLILHGLGLGALLATKAFATGFGNGLLLWEAPSSANEVLRVAVLHYIAVDQAFKYGEERKPTADYLRQLESDYLEVEGYRISGKLWRESFTLRTLLDEGGEAATDRSRGRPLRLVKLDKSAGPLFKGGACELINPDLSGLFADNFEWITEAYLRSAGENSENIH